MQDILFGRCEKWLVNIYKKHMEGLKKMEIKRLTKEELQDFARLKDYKIENLYYRGDISLLQKPEKVIALIK